MAYAGFDGFERTMRRLKADGLRYAQAGDWYLTECVSIVADEGRPMSTTKELYPLVAKNNLTTAAAVERAIRRSLRGVGCEEQPRHYIHAVASELMGDDD